MLRNSRGILEKSRPTIRRFGRPSSKTPIADKNSISRYAQITIGTGSQRVRPKSFEKAEYNFLRDQNELLLTLFEKVKYNVARAQCELGMTRFEWV